MPTGLSSGFLDEISKHRHPPGFRRLPGMLSQPCFNDIAYLTIPQLHARHIYDIQTFWLLAGIAVRLGTRLTGYNDSESNTDSVYNSKLRRRLWRQIIWIDARSHHHIGLKPLLSGVRAFTLPANLNDADINPDMTVLPVIHKGPTEMTCECFY